MYENINERISVVAIFGDTYQSVRPFKLRWKSKDYVIKKVGYQHKFKEGQNIIHVFSATDGINFFELKFNANELSWLIGRVGNNEAN